MREVSDRVEHMATERCSLTGIHVTAARSPLPGCPGAPGTGNHGPADRVGPSASARGSVDTRTDSPSRGGPSLRRGTILAAVNTVARARSVGGELVAPVKAVAQAFVERAVERAVLALDMNAVLDQVDINALLARADVDKLAAGWTWIAC